MNTKSDQETGDVDLFGNAVVPLRDRRGRPSYQKNKENQSTVAVLKAAGWGQDRIAAYMGCDPKTLRKYFSRELAIGADLIEGEAIEVLVAKMRRGSDVAAARVLKFIESRRAETPDPSKPESEAEKPAPLGKKEQLDEAAKNPGSRWGDLLN